MKQKPVVEQVGCSCGQGTLAVEITVHREGALQFSTENVVGPCGVCGSTDLAAARDVRRPG